MLSTLLFGELGQVVPDDYESPFCMQFIESLVVRDGKCIVFNLCELVLSQFACGALQFNHKMLKGVRL